MMEVRKQTELWSTTVGIPYCFENEDSNLEVWNVSADTSIFTYK